MKVGNLNSLNIHFIMDAFCINTKYWASFWFNIFGDLTCHLDITYHYKY